MSSLVHDIPVRALFQANFGLMTSLSWHKTSKILRKSVRKWSFFLQSHSTFYSWFSSIYQHWHMEYQSGPLFDPSLGWWRHQRQSKLQNFEIVVSKKRILYLQFPFTIEFHFSITIGTWNTSLGPFGPNFGLMIQGATGVKTAIFWKWPQKQTSHFRVPSNADFDFFITLDTWYTTLGPFYLIQR